MLDKEDELEVGVLQFVRQMQMLDGEQNHNNRETITISGT